ncbi:hypothetical protein AMTR_s00110p00065160 [Amborella trichopoda]|uniref:Biotin carboxyl carrier protein of acetyl-CoA carboxylase n=1 Tax=Amborella trichopoda TaxID=13333 RepID=W1NX86_AMBTC|nr:hypothetical protein AMTR_s00110p00065160 [Amborella trichopoda]
MASSLPATSAGASGIASFASEKPQKHQQKVQGNASFPASLKNRPSLLRYSGPNRILSTVWRAQLNEVAVEASNAVPTTSKKSDSPLPKDEDIKPAEETSPKKTVSEASINAFMAEVANLVKLVDSRDIMELQMKQLDCELTIRKKEALPQPPPAPAPVMMHSPTQYMIPQQMPPSQPAPPPPVPASPASSSGSALALPVPSGKSSKSPPLKSPMAGTFYQNPAPGEPPFVKVGDKIQKGQVVCIIEAMKLMNEIEADQSGTVVEIIAQDGKPVSVDTK